jgi:ABC-2 type transport system ATP-binding protein
MAGQNTPTEQSLKDDYAVSARGLFKSFGELKVLNDLSIKIPRGTTYCLLGPNGSGKTTFIRSIVGIVRLDEGEMYVLDVPVSDVKQIYSKIGYMTQHKALYPDLTLQENMEFYAGLYGISGRKRYERITELLEMVELSEHRNRLTGDLSGGMYQRLSLASTLIHEPELLLLDEPTVGVDPMLRQAFWEYFDDLTEKGVTIVVTTHLMDEAERCKTVGFMRAGKMLAEGSPEDMKRRAKLRPVLEMWMDEPKQAANILSVKGFDVQISGDAMKVSLDSHEQINEVLSVAKPMDFRIREPTLADAFLRLVEEREV